MTMIIDYIILSCIRTWIIVNIMAVTMYWMSLYEGHDIIRAAVNERSR